VVYDELVHASVHSGLRASRVPSSRRVGFAHNDVEALRTVLRRIGNDGSTVFLALESLYSMDGDFAPLKEILDVLNGYIPRERQCVVLDEAHSTAIYGDKGRGVAHLLGEAGGGRGRVGVRLMTFGKAVGCSGGEHSTPRSPSRAVCAERVDLNVSILAVLLCSLTIRSFLINFARPLIFSTALPHSTLIALECAWDLLQSEKGDRVRLSRSASYPSLILHDSFGQTSSP